MEDYGTVVSGNVFGVIANLVFTLNAPPISYPSDGANYNGNFVEVENDPSPFIGIAILSVSSTTDCYWGLISGFRVKIESKAGENQTFVVYDYKHNIMLTDWYNSFNDLPPLDLNLSIKIEDGQAITNHGTLALNDGFDESNFNYARFPACVDPGWGDGLFVAYSLSVDGLNHSVFYGKKVYPAGASFNNFSIERKDKTANQMYYAEHHLTQYDQPIGYSCTETEETYKYNKNITFGETKESSFKEKLNMIKWTDLYGMNFPDLFFKALKEPVSRIIAAPSFLKMKYANTAIIFTRNTVNRFVLEGSADGWRGSAESLISEHTQFGLYAENSLVRAGSSLFWLSEAGAVKWNAEGFGLINRNVIDIPIKDSLIGFHSSVRNQYILHDNDTTISYVYHIDAGIWTKFKGLDIVSVATLSAGESLANVNLMLKSDNSIVTYPDEDTYTTEDAILVTKDLYFSKGVLQKVKLDYDGGTTPQIDVNVAGVQLDGTEYNNDLTTPDAKSNQWKWVNLRGHTGKIKITNAEEINNIMYDIKIDGEG